MDNQLDENIASRSLKLLMGELRFPLRDEELKRIKRYRNLLQDRFLQFTREDYPNGFLFEREFNSRGFTYDPNNVHISAYGEIFEACVQEWGSELASELHVPHSNLTLLSNLSITAENIQEIDTFRLSQEGGVPPTMRI